jgi:hypothetical protein
VIESAERSVLHSILMDESLMNTAAHGLTPADFSVRIAGDVFRAALGLWKSNRPIEPGLVAREVKGDFLAVSAYLADLDGGTIKPKAFESYCQIVSAAAKDRKLRAFLSSAIASNKSHAELATEVAEAMGEFSGEGSDVGRDMLVSAARFCSTMPTEIEWLIEGIIPRNSNGIIAGEPKASKSWIADEISLALASGTPFLGRKSFNVPRPVRTALFAREDYPGLTSWRLSALFRSRTWPDPNFFDNNLFINSRAQTDEFYVDNPQHVDDVIRYLRRFRIEFALFDVLNILHEADENDNSEMRRIMARFSHIQAKANCSIGLIHHLGKSDGKWTRRLRGASSIHGWVEWLIGVSEVDEAEKIRKMEFELKAAESPHPVHYQIQSEKGSNVAQIVLCDGPDTAERTERRAARWQ